MFSQMATRTLSFLSLFHLFTILHLSEAFLPQNNFLINCGSNLSVTVDNRNFLGDSTQPGSNYLSADKSISLASPISNTKPSNLSFVYSTARVFTIPTTYSFNIKKNGTHLVRFHFSPFSSQNYNLQNANFGVSANGLSLLTNFVAHSTVVKEFVLMVDKTEFDILFSPFEDSGFAFVNAIEVFSAPDDLIVENGAKLIEPNGIEEFKDLRSQTLETVHRINVGGSTLTSFNDTLWRTWVPDLDFLVLKSAAKTVVSTVTPNYQEGGASKEIAPDLLYMTAREMNRDNMTEYSNFNITWDFPVESGEVRHLVRLHFCDIVSLALNQLYFDVYLNKFLAYKDLDLSTLTFHTLASPFYIDFVVDSDNSGVVQVSLGPSELSSPLRKNAILNGVEIMKVVNFVAPQIGSRKRGNWVLSGWILGGGLGALSFIFLAVFLLFKCRKRKRKLKPAESMGWTALRVGSSQSKLSYGTVVTSPSPNGYFSVKIPFVDLQLSTNNFDKNLIVGSGGFGIVYKAVLKDNTKVAVKRGVPGSRQGLPEFQTEITVLSRIRHRHLVSLVGYCEEQSEMILVYEYMEKGPLKNHLYGSGLPPLSWKQRLEICIGAARGLHYLHTGSVQGIIHRDIKSTNILLDENYLAKVADFGLSRDGPCLDETHVSTGVKGSFGYLDPEYFRRQQLTDKSDVYSFGVVLFEVLCARPAVDPLLSREQVNLGEWAMIWQKKGLLEQIIDSNLVGDIKTNSLKKVGETAEKCLAEYGVDRPTMGDVLWNLEYALQLQESETDIENEDAAQSNINENMVVGPRVPMKEGSSEGTSYLRSSKVFSQLVTNEGR